MVQMDASNYKSEDDVAGGVKPLAGIYHVVITRAEDGPEKFPDKVIVDFRVLAGTVPGQEKTEITEFFATTPRAMPRLTRLAMCIGLLGPNEKKDVDFAEAEGRQCVIEVVDREYTKKGATEPTKTVNIDFMGIWSVGNKEVVNVPKDEKALAGVPENAQGSESQEGGSGGAAGNGEKWDEFV